MTLALTEPEYEAAAAKLRISTLDCLAPKMRNRVEAALRDCAAENIDAIVFETCRGDELAKLYYEHKVSNAPNALKTWHHYGLAVDVISKANGWDLYPGGSHYEDNPWWWKDLYQIFRSHGLDSGSDWRGGFRDWPHWQFDTLKASPSDRAVELLGSGGVEAVWREVGAI